MKSMTTPNINSINTAAVVNGGDMVLSFKTVNESKKEEHWQQPVHERLLDGGEARFYGMDAADNDRVY